MYYSTLTFLTPSTPQEETNGDLTSNEYKALPFWIHKYKELLKVAAAVWVSSAKYGHLPPSCPPAPSNSHCWTGTEATAAACPRRRSDRAGPAPASEDKSKCKTWRRLPNMKTEMAFIWKYSEPFLQGGSLLAINFFFFFLEKLKAIYPKSRLKEKIFRIQLFFKKQNRIH